jgi:hypothetical protein
MRREVDKMKGKLLGVLGVLLLAVLATPAMATELDNIIVNESGLYLTNFSVEKTGSPNTYNFSGYFINVNDTSALQAGTIYLYINGNKTDVSNSSIEIQANTTTWEYLFNYTFKDPGDYTVSVGNETDWLRNKTLWPDLNVTEITLNPPQPRLGESVTVTVTVNNTGNFDVTQSFNVSLYVDDQFKENRSITALNASESKTVSFSWTPSALSHTLRAVVESINGDSNPRNNEKSIPISIQPPEIKVSPTNGTVNTVVSVSINSSTGCLSGYVTVFFKNDTYSRPVLTNSSFQCQVGSGDVLIGNFTVPSVSVGKYWVEARNATATTSTAEFWVVPSASQATLADLGMYDLNLSKSALREDETLYITIAANSSKLGAMNVTLALVNKTNFESIKSSVIDAKKALYSSIILANAYTYERIAGDKVLSASLPADDYYVVVFNTSAYNDTVDLYNADKTVHVASKVVNVSLSEMGITWEIVGNKLNVSDVVEGNDVKIPINATRPVNIAVIAEGDWVQISTPANISKLTRDDIVAKAKWYQLDFSGNKTLNVPKDRITVGTFNVVVFNTTDSYIYYYNDSTKFNVKPYPKSATLEQLGANVNLNNTTMNAVGGAISLRILDVTKYVHIAVVNNNTYTWMKNVIEKKDYMTNESLANNATRYFETSSEQVNTLSDLVPDLYYVVVYSNVTVGSTEYVNYYNDSIKFTVVLIPVSAPLLALNITRLDVNGTTFNYGDHVGLQVNVTGTANFNLVILKKEDWDNLKAQLGVKNSTIIGKSKWNVTNLNSNSTETIQTIGKLYPGNYVVVAYNTTTAGGEPFVYYYNDSRQFSVSSKAQLASFEELGINVFALNKTSARVGEDVRLDVNFTKALNIVVMNETNWTNTMKSPSNETAIGNAVFNWTNVNGSRILTFSITTPDRYVVVAYEDLNGVIGKYNDSLKLEVKSLARSCNISDLATVFDVSPTTLKLNESVKITLQPTTGVNVAILKEADWSSIKAGQSIRNSTILNNSIWSITNVGSNEERVMSVPMRSVGDYVVVLYNVTQYDYVDCYNDSKTFKVSPPPQPDLTVSISPVTAVLGQAVNVSVTVSNAGDADAGAFKVALYVNENKVGEKTVDSLAAGASKELTFSWTPPAVGTYTLKAVADTEDVIKESNEDNNMASTTVTVKAAEPWQNYDKDRSGKIETSELITAIQDWLSNKLSTKDLINVIQKWLQS